MLVNWDDCLKIKIIKTIAYVEIVALLNLCEQKESKHLDASVDGSLG